MPEPFGTPLYELINPVYREDGWISSSVAPADCKRPLVGFCGRSRDYGGPGPAEPLQDTSPDETAGDPYHESCNHGIASQAGDAPLAALIALHRAQARSRPARVNGL
jgi:hypothetical protein